MRSVASVLFVWLVFGCAKVTASVREVKEGRVAYVVRWEPELENIINPKRKRQQWLIINFSCRRQMDIPAGRIHRRALVREHIETIFACMHAI